MTTPSALVKPPLEPPRIVLRTRRFALREMTVDDAQSMFELNSDPLVLRYTGNDPWPSVEAARVFLEQYEDYRLFGMGRWAIVDAHSTFYGWCGLKTLRETGEVDVGYRLLRRYWGQGIATETAAASLHHGFETLNLQQIVATAAIDDPASVRVLEKIGMTKSGSTTCGTDPALTFTMTRDAWRARSSDSRG